MPEVYVSIGSNIEPKININRTKSELNKLFNCKFSKDYCYPSEGFEGKDFTNLVASFSTEINVKDLKDIFKRIEGEVGRDSSQAGFTDRVIDIDIILYGMLILDADYLTLPSPEIENYLFVLEPLVEIAGNSRHPVTGERYKDILRNREVK